jgi:lipopolysaccharide transport system ATP-binding protein
MQPVIKAEGLSKRYALGLTHAGSVRELVNRSVTRLRGRSKTEGGKEPVTPQADHVWALRDVSFEVQAGEVLGIIGRNGAGKSTLLKILSRITRPTEGRVEMRRRVASLLEVGTGFHPELTGRENVYMNGTVLGMSRREIERQFDSIVDFAGVETFIDTPVKRYSSGMAVRLGFAVAAHMSPEILIIDEVLAVGDAEFQKRCIGKMDDVAKSGRTVLFVSHNMASIRQLAPRSLLIQDGKVEFDGDTDTALDRYLGHGRQQCSLSDNIQSLKRPTWVGDRSQEITAAEFVENPAENPGRPMSIRLSIKANTTSKGVRIGSTIFAADGSPVGSYFLSHHLPMLPGELTKIAFSVDSVALAPGNYWMTLGLLNSRNQVTDVVEEVLHFRIPDGHNVPSEFVQWIPNWGPARFTAQLEFPGQ